MKSISSKTLALCALFGCAANVYAIPTLQVGVPTGSGGYAIYDTVGSDEDTAFTSGTSLVVGGAYSQGQQELLIGGQASGGQSWATVLQASFGGSLGDYAAFSGKGAVLVASVANGSVGSGALTINGFTIIK